MRGWRYALAQAVEKRSYSRISGETSQDSVTASCGKRRAIASPRRPLVIRIGEAVQQPDRHGLDVLGGERVDRTGDARFIEWDQQLPLRIDPLGDRQAQPARNERRRQIDVDVVLLEAVFVADLDHVAEALGGEKRGPGALALDERIGGERRAMDDHADFAGLDTRLGRDRAQSGST